MFRTRHYDKRISLDTTTETYEILVKLAEKQGFAGCEKNAIGETLKQPKKGVSTFVRHIVEEYIKHAKDLDKPGSV